MKKKQTHYRFTTPQQRKLLFQTWEETKNVTQACKKAHVCCKTFYNWKARFLQDGYAGLEEFASRAAHHVQHTPEEVVQQVTALRQAYPDWGKRRILIDAGLWSANKSTQKGG